MPNYNYTPRIVALGMQGHSALWISQLVGCAESHAASVLLMWRASGGEVIGQQPRRRPMRVAD